MSAVTWFMGVIALLACAGAVYVILEHPVLFAPRPIPTLSMVVPTSLEVGKPFDVKIDGYNHVGETLTLTAEEKLYQRECKTDPCTFVIPLTINTQGDYVLFLQTPTQYAQLPIHVSLKTSVCIDGTLEGACSTKMISQRCVYHQLLPDCSVCGCAEGLLCQDSVCIPPSYSFTIQLEPPAAFYSTATAPLNVLLTNTGTFTITDFFLIYVDAFNSSNTLLKSFPQQVKLNEINPASLFSISIPVQLPASTHHLSVRVFHSTIDNPEEKFIHESSPLSIIVQSDSTPPSPPGTVSYQSSGNGYTLAWGASSSNDVQGYLIYQQNNATGGFTTYSVLAETSALTYALSSSDGGKAYAIKAKDWAGNESAAAAPVFIP
ncbi:MAG: hypothetical protein AABX02_04300 [archaeon]